jgi:hypothetical protein
MFRSAFVFVCSFFAICLANRLGAQCTGCNTVVLNNSVANYTVNSNQKLCVASNFTYTGNIYLNGGTVCNDGTIEHITFYSGTFNNNLTGAVKTPTNENVTVALNGKLTINNYSGAQFLAQKDFTVSGGSNDSLILNIHKGSLLSCNNFSLSSGKARITIGLAATSVTNAPFVTSMNANGNVILKSHLNVLIKEKASLNVTGNFKLLDEGIKTINNYGILNVLGEGSISGNGNNTSTVTINNYEEMDVFNSFVCNMTNAMVRVNTFTNTAASSVLYSEPNFSIAGNSNVGILNNAALEVEVNAYIMTGTVTNNAYFSSTDLTVDEGVFTNNFKTIINGDFLITDANGIVNNNNAILVSNDFVNIGSVNFAQKSILKTANFENQYAGGNPGFISGPNNILDQRNAEDDRLYAKVLVTGSSSNAGTIEKYIFFVDYSYSGHEDVHVDVVDVTSDIGPYVKSGLDVDCQYSMEVGYLTARTLNDRGGRAFYCPGENIILTLNAYVPIISLTWSYSISCTGIVSTSGNPVTIPGVLSSGTVFLAGTYSNSALQVCNFTMDFVITVSNGSITATSPVYFGVDDPVTLNPTVTVGAAPYTFTWTPNLFFVAPDDNHIGSPKVNPQVSFVYTVNMTDRYGCTGSTTVMVIGQPFAVLDKQLNGEYYKLFNDKLFFIYEGQYDVAGLKYNVYNGANSIVADNQNNNLVNITSVSPGDNRLTLDASSLTTGYYILELINEKKEKMYLRFKR